MSTRRYQGDRRGVAGQSRIAITKSLAYLLSGSSSMLAESVHSLADSGNQVLLLIGGKRANGRPPRSIRWLRP